MAESIQQEIKTYIVDNFLFGSGGDTLTPEASLLEQGIIDSSGVLELVGYIESTYEIQVLDEEIVPENFDSIKRIESYIIQKQKK